MADLFHLLPAIPRRKHLPRRLDCSNPRLLTRYFQELLDRPLPHLPAIRKWLQDSQELQAAISEYDALTYIRKSINTRDRQAQKDYLHLIQKVTPALSPLRDRMNQRLLVHPLRKTFPKRWGLLLRHRQTSVDLFRQAHVPLEKKEGEMVLQYSHLMGGMEAEFDGSRKTIIQIGAYLERTDRPLRQQAWETICKRIHQDRGRFEKIYDGLLQLRQRMARHAGFKNFRDYWHLKCHRFDYAPGDCFQFHDSVEEVVLPVLKKIRENRRREMNLPALRPWDVQVDPRGRPPLKPFTAARDLSLGACRVFGRMNPVLKNHFQKLVRHGLLDLENRPGKEPGGYQCTLPERQLPFIFMNAVGRHMDLHTLLHEAGHAFHTMATRGEPILDYRDAPLEFCEVASMSMELLSMPHLKVFYPDPDQHRRCMRNQLEGVLEILPRIAIGDAFQHWVYTHPDHSRSERASSWMKLRRRFQDGVDWSGFEHFEKCLWHRQGHFFNAPFYFIEYGIAQIGALMVWHQSLKNPGAALQKYQQSLSLGGSVGLKELFKAAGGKLDFSKKTLKPLVETILGQLERL